MEPVTLICDDHDVICDWVVPGRPLGRTSSFGIGWTAASPKRRQLVTTSMVGLASRCAPPQEVVQEDRDQQSALPARPRVGDVVGDHQEPCAVAQQVGVLHAQLRPWQSRSAPGSRRAAARRAAPRRGLEGTGQSRLWERMARHRNSSKHTRKLKFRESFHQAPSFQINLLH